MKAFLLFCLFTLPLVAAEKSPNVLSAEEKSAGWKLLFDGKTTAGWRGYHQKTFPTSGWSVENGCLKNAKTTGRPGGGGGDIITDEAFDNFEFKFEFQVSPGGNSGVKYFLHEERPGSAIAHEYQLLDDAVHPDGKNGPIRQTAALYSLIPPTNKTFRPIGEFNEGRILVQGKHVEHWLNGSKVVEYELDSPRLRDAIKVSKYKDVPGFGSKVSTPLLLQDHGDEIHFRNLKIRSLPLKDQNVR